MIRFPNCKINLGISILEKLPDGYHRLETVFYPLGLSDILEILPSEKMQVTVTGSRFPGSAEDNLCYKAWQLIQAEYQVPPVQMHLHKIIPTGAGLGGGSSDAAFTLRMLNEMFELNLTDEQLMDLAARLGMDCPYFILNSPALGTGRGEILQPVRLNLKGYFLVLVKPEVHVSTKEAYAGVKPAPAAQSLIGLLKLPVTAWRDRMINDFEKSVIDKHPEIGHIKDLLYEEGAAYASMSGSGSAVYGIFREAPELKNTFPGCFSWTGKL